MQRRRARSLTAVTVVLPPHSSLFPGEVEDKGLLHGQADYNGSNRAGFLGQPASRWFELTILEGDTTTET